MITLVSSHRKHENSFTEYCQQKYISITDTRPQYLHRQLSQRIALTLKDPLIPSDLRSWIKERGFHINGNGSLCVLSNEEEGSVAKSKVWKLVADIEDYYNIIRDHHFNHSATAAGDTYENLMQVYSGVPFAAVERFVDTCPGCIDATAKAVDSSNSCHLPTTAPAIHHLLMNGCNGHNAVSKKNSKKKFMRKGQVEIIPAVSKDSNSVLKSFAVGLYLDTWSNYHILFPVHSDNDSGPSSEHFASSITKRVYPYYGVPSTLISTRGTEFVEEVIRFSSLGWPDATVISNGCTKLKGQSSMIKGQSSMIKRAEKSKTLIRPLLEGCGREFGDIELSLSATEDFLLSIQYKINIVIDKKSRKCPYELVFGQLPIPGPHTQQLLSHRELIDPLHSDDSDNSDDEEKRVENGGGVNQSTHTIACFKNLDSEENQQQQIMSRLISSSSSNSASATATNQKQLQQMLSAGTIQAQEQQVTSLRELLRQEEKRLEMLKQMRSTPGSKKAPPPPSTGTVHVTGIDSTHGVIRSTHGIIQSTRDNSTPISSRLQQLVDSVAVNQMSSKASQLKSSLQTVGTNQTAIQQSKASSLTIPQNGIQRGAVELDEATILRTIENSSRYRDFLVKQSNLKRNFQKQIDKKIGSAPYPKTFRQVWPIIPVHDPSFVKNIGLETVTLFFDPAYKKPIVQPSKMKPTCNQCGCDFASAWQIRKNNSKQVLLCESCDFTNLKLFQRSKLATQLKELMENVQKEEEKFKEECDETKKQTMAVERAALLNPKQQPVVNIRNAAAGTSQDVSGKSFNATSLLPNGGTPHIATVQPGKTTASAGSTVETEGTRKRKSLEDHGISKVARTTANLNHTLNKISQQLVRKQVDEKVGKRQQHQTVPTHVVSKPKGPPPLKQVSPLNKTAPVQIPSTYSTVRETTTRSTPPPLINSNSKGNNSVGNESRKSRRKGTPRHKLMGGSD